MLNVDKLIGVVEEAGSIALDFYRGSYDVSEKDDGTIVTEADYAVNDYLLEELPDYPVLSEEGGRGDRFDSDTVWIVDPIDGTSQFHNKHGQFKIYVGLAQRGEPVAGFIHAPLIDTIYYGVQGEGAYVRRNGEERPLLFSDADPYTVIFREEREDLVGLFHKKTDMTASRAGFSSIFILDGLYNAKVTVQSEGAEWDNCAPHAILREAGGRLTRVTGEEVQYNKKEPIVRGTVKSDGRRHEEIVSTVDAR